MRTNGEQANPTTILLVVSAQAAVPVTFTLVDGSQQTTALAVVDTEVTTAVEAYTRVVVTFKPGFVSAEELGEALERINQLPASENAITVGGVAVQLGEWTVFVPAAPTHPPTDEPTAAPTHAPTDAPTAAPTDAPTDAPDEGDFTTTSGTTSTPPIYTTYGAELREPEAPVLKGTGMQQEGDSTAVSQGKNKQKKKMKAKKAKKAEKEKKGSALQRLRDAGVLTNVSRGVVTTSIAALVFVVGAAALIRGPRWVPAGLHDRAGGGFRMQMEF